jgi:hypothetical protein
MMAAGRALLRSATLSWAASRALSALLITDRTGCLALRRVRDVHNRRLP